MNILLRLNESDLQQLIHTKQNQPNPSAPHPVSFTLDLFETHSNLFDIGRDWALENFNWSIDQVQIAVRALYQCLIVKAYAGPSAELYLSVPVELDQIWHQLILNTKLYQDFCNDVCGRIIHHTTLSAKDLVAQKNMRVEAMRAEYERLWKQDTTTQDFWRFEDQEPKLKRTQKRRRTRSATKKEAQIQSVATFNLLVKTITGNTTAITHCVQGTPIYLVQKRIRETEGSPIDEQRLLFGGKQLDPNEILANYGITENSTIHLVKRLRGC